MKPKSPLSPHLSPHLSPQSHTLVSEDYTQKLNTTINDPPPILSHDKDLLFITDSSNNNSKSNNIKNIETFKSSISSPASSFNYSLYDNYLCAFHTSSSIMFTPSETKFLPFILLIPIRVGVKDVGSDLFLPLAMLFTFPCFLGIVGGKVDNFFLLLLFIFYLLKPRSSYYFIACQDSSFYYLDPHTTQSCLLNKEGRFPVSSLIIIFAFFF
jgi:hypothetical protein